MSDLLESKTMKLVLLTLGAVLLVFLVAVVAEAVFGVRIPYVAETFAALTGNTGIGAARNAYVDAPIRQANAAQSPAATGYGPPPR